MNKLIKLTAILLIMFTIFGQQTALCAQTKKANIYNSQGKRVGYKKETYQKKSGSYVKTKDEYYDTYNHRQLRVQYR